MIDGPAAEPIAVMENGIVGTSHTTGRVMLAGSTNSVLVVGVPSVGNVAVPAVALLTLTAMTVVPELKKAAFVAIPAASAPTVTAAWDVFPTERAWLNPTARIAPPS